MFITDIPFSATAAGTNSGATATEGAVAGRTHVVTEISGHTDTDSLIQILDGAAVVWQSKVDVSVDGLSFSFPGLNVLCSNGVAAGGKVASSTTDCQVNISGGSIP